MTAVSAMLRDAAHKAKYVGPDDIGTYVATYEAIVAHIEQQIRNLDSTCCAAIAFEHVADAFASKQVWQQARETYSQALQVMNGTDATSSFPGVTALNHKSAMQQQPAGACAFTVLQKFANACMHLKDYDGAWNAHQECLDIVKPTSFPITDSRIVTVVGNMGHVQYAKSGAAAAMGTAITIYKQCLSLQRSLSSRDLLAEANTMSKIGFIFRQGGRLDTAITWYEGAIEVRTEVLGDDHVGLSSGLLAIGNIHYSQGELDCALAAFSECLSLDRSSSPDSNPCFVVYVLDKMGGICVQLEYHTFAIKCYEDLVSIARAEAVHSRSLAMAFARSLYNLAVIYNAEGHLSKAIDSAEESIQVGILESSLAFRCLAFIISLYLKTGDAEKAQTYQMISDVLEGKNESRECRPAKRCKTNNKNQGAAAA